MLVSGGQILAIDKVNTGNTILGDGVQEPLVVNTDLIATTSSVSNVSAALEHQIDVVSGKFDNYYTKEETSGAQQIQDAFDKFKTTQTIVSAGKNVGVYSAYNENGVIVYTVSADDVERREVKIVGDDGIAVSFDDVTSAWNIGISANYQSAGNYVSADDFNKYKDDVAQEFVNTSAWANETFLKEHQSLDDYYKKSETSGAEEISNALLLKQDVSAMSAYATSAWVDENYQKKGNYVSADDFNEYKTQVSQEFANTSSWANAKFKEKGEYVSASDFEDYKEKVEQDFKDTSAWANETFQPIGEYISASEKFLSANALDDISGKWESVYDTVDTNSAAWNAHSALSATKLDASESAKFMKIADLQSAPENTISGYGESAFYYPPFPEIPEYSGKDGIKVENYEISISADYLSANALDELSGKWEDTANTVSTASGSWNEASAFGANSGKFVTSADFPFENDLAYFLKKQADESMAWSGVDLSDLGKIYPISSLTPNLISATVSAMGETSGYVLSAKEPEPFIQYSISASMMSAWTGIDNDVNYYFLSGANINSNNGISAEYIPEANQWNIGLDKTNLVTYARFHTSNNTYTTSAEITGFAQDDYIGTDIYLDNAEVYANSGLYHVDMQVGIIIPGNDNNYHSTILKSTTAPSRQVQQEIDGSYAHTETISLSYDIRVATDATKLTYTIEDLPRNTTFFVKDLNVHRVICSLSEIGGSTYQAGDGLLLQNDTFSVDIGDGLELSGNHIQVKLGEGLKFDENAGVKAITINNQVEDVVERVEKLSDDLDKKITTTYPFAQITSMSDFAQYGVTNTTRMIGQLFAVPIASEIRKDETLLCVNALQNFSGNVSFGIFEYDFEGNGGTGSTYWIADTGTVSISAGENLFPLKYVLNDAHELQSSKLYYAVVAVAANAPATGLLLGSSPAYAQNVNANPKYTLIVSNMDQAIDWATGTLQGAWFQGYNEQYDIPRLFMMLRNGEGSTPIPVTEPFTNISTFTLQHQYRVSAIFSLTPDAEGGVYRKVIPAQDVDITSFRYVDYHGSVPAQTSYPVLLNDTYTPIKSIGDGTWTLGNNDDTKIDGTHRVHEFTFTTPVHLTANTAYWFMVGGNLSDQGSDWLITYQTPAVTNDLLLVKNMYNVNSWIIPNSGEFLSTQPGMYLMIKDNNNESWII